MTKLWLRAETYGNPTPDTRTPLTPEQAKVLVAEGHEVFVEKAPHRVFTDKEYEQVGCRLVEPGSWYRDAPEDAYILGIKYIPKEERFDTKFPIPHNMIYFAHAWNGDPDASRIMSRLEERRFSGQKPPVFYDLEDLVDASGKRVAAFGYFAGYAGALLATHVWCEKELGKKPPYNAPDPSIGRAAMVALVKAELAEVEARQPGKKPAAVVIGPNGRCGKGAVEFLKEMGIEIKTMTRENTAKGRPFNDVLGSDIMLNCVSFDADNPKFINQSDLKKDIKLSVIGDVSCYPGPFNPVDIYDHITSYDNLTHTLPTKNGTVDVIAIENLPRLLAREASEEYSNLLFPHLKNLLDAVAKGNEMPAVWERARDKSNKFLTGTSAIKDLGCTISQSCFDGDSNNFNKEKAEKILVAWLERNPLSTPEIQGFQRFLKDGAMQVYAIRSGDENPDLKLKLFELNGWLDDLEVKRLCNSPTIAAHQDIETTADHFLNSATGRQVIRNSELRKKYVGAIDEAHHALNGGKGDLTKLNGLIEDAGKVLEQQPDMKHVGDQIMEAFGNLRRISSRKIKETKAVMAM